MKTTLMHSYIMDQIAVVVTTLSNQSISSLNTAYRVISVQTALCYIGIFSFEFLNQYCEVERLCKLGQDQMTLLDRNLANIFFEGLRWQEVKTN